MIRVVVTGIAGRMGGSVVRLLRSAEAMKLAGATEQAGSAHVGVDAGTVCGLPPMGVAVVDELGTALQAGADVAIDFSTPAASIAHARLCAQKRVALVVGTTGIESAGRAAIAEAARSTAILMAPNMSVGVNVMLKLVAQAARALGDGYDVEIVEIHHRHKKDAPSGTALRLGEVAAEALDRDPQRDFRTERSGIIGERTRKEIGIQTLRGGDVAGEHTVLFVGEGERLEVTHRATSRDQFALGALRAARFLVGRPPGLYDMFAVLGL